MVRFPEATARLFHKTYVCKRCKTKIKASPLKITLKKIKCRRCQGHSFRALKSKVSRA